MAVKLIDVLAVRVVCDRALLDRVLKEAKGFGATGYTWWEAYGRGLHEKVPDIETMSGWNSNFRGHERISVEIWCTRDIAEKIVAYCQGSQFSGIGMIAAIAPLQVTENEMSKLAK